jgi:AsmA protein
MRRSLKYPLIGIPVVAAVLAGGVAVLLPQLAAARLAERAESRHGLSMSVEGGSGFTLSDGLAITLDTVTFTRSDAQGVPLTTVGQIRIDNPLQQVLGGRLRRISLIDPVFTFTAADTKNLPGDDAAAAEAAPKATARPLDIAIENGAIKAADAQHNLALAVTDISGTLLQSEDGALDAELRGLFNGVATSLTLSVDDTRRLQQRGSPSDVTLASKAGQIVMSGRLRLTGALQFDGSVSAESDDTQSFLSWMGVPLAGLSEGVPLALDAGLSLAHAKARLRNLAFALGEMQAKGEIAVQAAAPRPAVTADLAFNSLNLNIYSRKGPASASAPPDLTKDWREAALPFDDLRSVDAEVALTTDSFTAGAVTAGPTNLKASLKDGALQAHVETLALEQGKGVLDLALKQDASTQMTLALDVAGVESKGFLGKAFGITFLSGPTDLKANLTASGSSPAQLISSLKGSATVSLRDGSVDGVDLAKLAGLVSGDDLEGWGVSEGSATAVSAAGATATFADGIGTLADTEIAAAGLTAKVEGNVDLLRRAVDLTVKPGKGLPLPVAARIRGPWERPKLSAKLDVEGVLRSGTGDGLEDAAKGVAKGAAKSAKKALKQLLGD